MEEKDTYFSILQWIVSEGIVNEKGDKFNFTDRSFLLDILTDSNPNIVVTACAQVGKSVTFSIKTLFALKHWHFNVIYTFPTESDVIKFVKSKFNKIIQQNRHQFLGMDTDSVQLKELNDRFLFFNGTVSDTAAISDTADLLIHDELSRSDQNTISTYKSRTKASQYKGRWLFSNPGTERDELDMAWIKSDQKEWVIECPHCQDRHFMTWPESFDIEEKCYICKQCKEPIDDDVRRQGTWEAQNGEQKISGYHISHLMCPWISAEEVIEDSEGDPAYFNNFVLGLAYSPGDLSVTKGTILDLWTPKDLSTGQIFLGVDVGNVKNYTIGTEKGIIKVGRFTKDSDLDDIIKFWKPTAGVVDAMPDSTFSKYLCETYSWMRMSYFMENQNNPQTIVWWGEGDKSNIVYSHRDRILDQMLTEMLEAKWLISVKADKEFALFIKHFETLRRVKVVNNKGIERYVWDSTTGEDHYCFSTLYYRLAVMSRGAGVFISDSEQTDKPPVIDVDNNYDVSTQFAQNNE